MDYQIEVSNLLKPLMETFKLVDDELNNLLETDLTEYLKSQTLKYYSTYTFLHRNKKVKFFDVYQPIEVENSAVRTDFLKLNNILNRYQYITIVGTAGSGKTTLARNIFMRCIQKTYKIPILIELRSFNNYNGSFEALIYERILKLDVKPNLTILKRALDSGNFLFLFDGYDEIFSSNIQSISSQIELFVDSYHRNNFIITTRPGSGIEQFHRFTNFRVCELDDDGIGSFITKNVHNLETRVEIINVIKALPSKNYYQYLRNPLLLSMFILSFESHPEVPNRRSTFYRNVFDTLYSRHDGITKNAFNREKLAGLQRDDYESILCFFCYLTLIEGRYSFTYEYLTDLLRKIKDKFKFTYNTDNLIYDLHTPLSIFILDGLKYFFPHRSMQEYFTALFISRLKTQKKQKAYDNISKILFRSSLDQSFNLWYLCSELDETAFMSFFLLPQLKSIASKLNSHENIDLVVRYIELIGAKIDVSHNDDSWGEWVIEKSSTFEKSILDFCDTHNYLQVYNFIQNKGLQETLSILIRDWHEENRGKSGSEMLHKQSSILAFLVTQGLTQIILEIRNDINQKINEIENNISSYDNNIDELLDID